MRKDDVLAYYDGNRAKAGRAVGVSRSAVQQWPDIIPEAMAYRFERVTGGRLKVDPSVYAAIDFPPQRRIARAV
jgi:transcriptional repressor of cell division inhibition gene dicB